MTTGTVQRQCPGSGTRWTPGTGSPICRVCHRGYRSLGASRPKRVKGRWVGLVPDHDRQVAER